VKLADILCIEVHKKWTITAGMVKRGVVVIDNGNSYEGKKVFGDVDYENVAPLATAITPVPGGVGPLLIMMLHGKGSIIGTDAHPFFAISNRRLTRPF
jgi:methylenetetrahydrofolate dehydrogenase (NADP+)/methenyltetrahydrofolate cyclohydrolase